MSSVSNDILPLLSFAMSRDDSLRNVGLWEKIGYEQKIQLSVGGTTNSIAGVYERFLPIKPDTIVGYYDGPLVDESKTKVHAIGSVVKSNAKSTTIRIMTTWSPERAPIRKNISIKNHFILLPTQTIIDLIHK